MQEMPYYKGKESLRAEFFWNQTLKRRAARFTCALSILVKVRAEGKREIINARISCKTLKFQGELFILFFKYKIGPYN